MDIILIYLLGSVIIGVLMFLLRDKLLNYLLFVPFMALQIMLNVHEFTHLNLVEGYYLGAEGEGFFKSDGIGLIFLTVITIVSVPVIIHSYLYSAFERDKIQHIIRYNISLLMLIAMMSCALISQHVAMTWAFIEATTLAASLLIYHQRNRAALEATWKYIFICSIGIAFSFIGILFLSIAAKDSESLNLTLESLSQNAKNMDPMWLKITFLLIVTGYSVKLGITPLFSVDIDAKDAAPAPVGAMLSAGLMNVGFVAVFRFYEIFARTSILSWMNNVLMILGMSSLFFATIFILRSKNIKRILAYSSLEHAGLALLGVAAGGYFGVIFHLILHSFAKASLFIQADHITRLFRTKNTDLIGGYHKLNPWGGTVLLLGFMAIMAIPPSGLFLTEFLTFKAMFAKGYYIQSVVALVLLSFIFYGVSKTVLQILFSPTPVTNQRFKLFVFPLESLSQWIMLGLVFYLGVNPPEFLTEFIKMAVENLPK